MLQKKGHLIEFNGFRLDVGERRLWRGEDVIALPPKVFDLLVILAENPGRLLEKQFLLEKLWPGSFVEEANLAVNVSTLRKALGEPSAGLIETVPKRGYRFTGEVVEIPAAVELPAPPPPAAIPASKPNRVLLYMLVGLLLGIVIGAAAWMFILDSGIGHSPTRIAVIPFLPLNGDPSQNYLGLGMADAIITRLSHLQRIVVTPTNSVIRYTNYKGDSRSVGRDLMVDVILEGHVQQYDHRIRLTVDLISVKDGRTLWAESYDDMFTNIFSVQDSVSAKIATALAMKLTGTERLLIGQRITGSTDAYSLYMQARYESFKRTSQGTLSAIEYLKQAVAKDPTFASAYSDLAFAYITRASWGWGDDNKAEAKSAALKALALDDRLPAAHLALGQVLMRGDWDWKGAARAFDRAIQLDRNFAGAYAQKSILMTALANHPEAVANMELACRLDPASAILRSDLAWTYYCSRQFARALENARKSGEMDPTAFTAHREMNKAYLMLGRYSDALKECDRAMAIIGHSRRVMAEIAQVKARAGQAAEATAILDQLRQPDPSEPEPTYLMAVAEANLGHKDLAFRMLDRAVRQRLVQAIWMNVDPELDAIRADPRFHALVKQAGLAE